MTASSLKAVPRKTDASSALCALEDKNPFIHDLRRCVSAMITERNALPQDSLFYPSNLWFHFATYMQYVRYLPEHELLMLRAHTGIMTGVFVYNLIHSTARDLSDEEKTRHNVINCRNYDLYCADLPSKYQIEEPIAHPHIRDICMPYKGKLLTDDIIRFQRSISNLYVSGIFKALEESPKPHGMILEIGGGYGGVAHHIKKILSPKKFTYVMVDLPEMLFWTGTYLTIHNPEARIFIYDPENPKYLGAKEAQEYDFMLIPNYAMEKSVEDFVFNLSININSMQEMTEPQIRFYGELIGKKLEGWLFAENFLRHIFNKQLEKNVVDILRDYFLIKPSQQEYLAIEQYINSQMGPDIWRFYPAIGTSRQAPCLLEQVRNSLYLGPHTINQIAPY